MGVTGRVNEFNVPPIAATLSLLVFLYQILANPLHYKAQSKMYILVYQSRKWTIFS